jgi:hypothetical protein
VYGLNVGNTKTLRTGLTTSELAALLDQLAEQKRQMEHLLGKVENVLRGVNFPCKTDRPASMPDGAAQARKSPLDQLKAVLESTSDLREANGNLSAARVAKVFGVSLSRLAEWLGRTKQALSKTPDADSLQETLGYFERVARPRMIAQGDAEFRKWLRTPHELLDNAPPLKLLARREWQTLADYVENILTGNPG